MGKVRVSRCFLPLTYLLLLRPQVMVVQLQRWGVLLGLNLEMLEFTFKLKDGVYGSLGRKLVPTSRSTSHLCDIPQGLSLGIS